MLPSATMQTISFDDHYKPMERVFVMNKLNVCVWVMNGCICLGSMIAFLMIDGRELVYSLYIPLDFLLNLCKVAFFFYHYYLDSVHKAEVARLAEHAKTKIAARAKNMATGLLNPDNDDAKSETSGKGADSPVAYMRVSTKRLVAD
jgi:hypothetical protein